jgi:hypothetical protein
MDLPRAAAISFFQFNTRQRALQMSRKGALRMRALAARRFR